MASRDNNGGDMDAWNDPVFQSTTFDESMATDSPNYDFTLQNFTHFNDAYDDSTGLNHRTPSKTGWDMVSTPAAQQQQQFVGMPVGASAESSSQDSASDSSSRRKRKVTESPMSDTNTELGIKKEDSMIGGAHMEKVQSYGVPTRPMNQLSLDPESAMDSSFDFNSAASSPSAPREYNQAVFSTQAPRLQNNTALHRYQPSPTINPHIFEFGENKPAVTEAMLLSGASPNAVTSTPSSDSNELFGTNSMWGALNPTWSGDTMSTQYASPATYRFPASPSVNGTASSVVSRGSVAPLGRCPLYIAPISTKSRVETQINVHMIVENLPANIEWLHLPLHTIAKSKLLAKEDYDKSRVLELHVYLVCTSAMQNPQLREKALKRAAAQNNSAIQRRAEQQKRTVDEEKNDPKNVDEADKPLNGGEVRICTNCIQRERKRAGRKKLKKEEEQQHWERFETERVVVFNSNEYLPFKPYDPSQRDTALSDDQPYSPPEGAMQVQGAMRIACYCRHQSEKEGFRVIFTMKDQQGNVVAQQMSDSILITDDHKTHGSTFPAGLTGEMFYTNPDFASPGLTTSQSMMHLPQHGMPFNTSKSMTDLSAFGQQFNPHSHIHQMPRSGYTSQATSATMTPTSLSRPASPTGAGQMGPNKKRKSSGAANNHKRLPSGLQMTPRVDTNQPPSSNMPSAISMTSPVFSPSADGFGQSYMTIPNHNGPAQFYGSGPPTPSENYQQGGFTEAQLQAHFNRSQNAQAYFSHPSSAVPSRAQSPTLHPSRPNLPAYARHPIQTPTNIQGRHAYQQHLAHASAGADQDQISTPTITKITPNEGPTMGGTEVSVYGFNFQNGSSVMFGDQQGITTYYGPQALLAITPPSRPGGVNVAVVPSAGLQQPQSGQYMAHSGNRQIFTYSDRDPQTMEKALRFYSLQQNGSASQWQQTAVHAAQQYTNQELGQSNMRIQSEY
ncbi:hypothetical protein BAUCODRAFT_147914 [Baudoinia panamericana UAMH 10762]|uniref:Uncharacterized protein n=1 Tax=Baudoinia panamericana (strain UAMH 10762) TaxID=717646 RepID=M2LPG3_BAUPA|nr:uncharacterized protein BAUCODRAFT_147914 [Baudoinia panamericana UAMH 10762]EMC96282.1 hypothetical protein BAUCODRAFT_147914 [Baudoinia panamericana UAMH 10762]